MAEKVTHKRVASKASKVLRDKRTGKDSRSTAGSALSQRSKVSRRMTLREAYDVAVALYGDVLKELAKH